MLRFDELGWDFGPCPKLASGVLSVSLGLGSGHCTHTGLSTRTQSPGPLWTLDLRPSLLRSSVWLIKFSEGRMQGAWLRDASQGHMLQKHVVLKRQPNKTAEACGQPPTRTSIVHVRRLAVSRASRDYFHLAHVSKAW